MTDKKLIRDCFEKSANTYDSVADIQKFSSQDLVNLINLEKVSSIIDIGCGTGNTSLALYTKYQNAKYTFCDISEKMLRLAKEKFPCEADTICCDAENYIFPQYYDLAISNLSLQWFDSPCAFIQKVKKISKSFALSTLINSSFEKYRSYFDIPPKFEYPSIEQLTQITGKNYTIKKYCVEFCNFYELTKYFIKLGAYAKGKEQPKIKSKYDGKIILDYEIFLCVI